MVNSVEYSRLDKLRILKFVYEEIKAYSGQEIKVSSIWRKAEEKRIVTNKLTTIKHHFYTFILPELIAGEDFGLSKKIRQTIIGLMRKQPRNSPDKQLKSKLKTRSPTAAKKSKNIAIINKPSNIHDCKLEKFHFFQFRKSRPWGRKNLLDSILQESIIFNKDKRYQKTLRKVLPVTKKPFLLRNVASGQRHFPWYLSMVEEFNNTVKPEEAFTAILQSNTESPNELVDDLVDENENYQVEEGREHSPLVVVEKSYPALEAVFALKQLQNLSIDPAIHQLDLSFVDNLEELEEKNVSADLLILLDFWNRVSQEYTVCHLDMFKDVEINNVTLWNETVKKAIEEREEILSAGL